MHNPPDPRLVMLGAAGGTQGGIASVIEAHCAQGLFKRRAPERVIARLEEIYADTGTARGETPAPAREAGMRKAA